MNTCLPTPTRKIAACPVQFFGLRRFLCQFLAATFLLGTSAAAQDVKVEKVADGLLFPEGPVWHPDGYLLFSDIHAATIQRLKPEGGSEPWFSQDKKTNGLILSADRTKVIAACHSDLQLISIVTKTRAVQVLARDFEGRKFHNMNDVAVDAEGNIFFSDPKWGARPEDVQGVYCYSRDGKLSLAAKMEKQPNGLVVSPDQKWLYVARSGGNDIWRFRLEKGGRLSDGAKWVDLGPKAEPDGMTVDSKGNIYQAQAGDGQVSIISPEGRILQRVKVFDRMATNCELQPGNESILYVTGGGSGNKKTGAVYRLTFPQEGKAL